VTAFLSLILNLILSEELEDEEIPELTADTADDEDDKEEWRRIRAQQKTNEDAVDEIKG